MKIILVLVVALLCGLAHSASAMVAPERDGGEETSAAAAVGKVAQATSANTITKILVTGTGEGVWTGNLPDWLTKTKEDRSHNLVIPSLAAGKNAIAAVAQGDVTTPAFVADAEKILKTGKVRGVHIYAHSAGCGGALLAGVMGDAASIDLYGTPDLGSIPDMVRAIGKEKKYFLDGRIRVHNNPKDPVVNSGNASPFGMFRCVTQECWTAGAAHNYSKDTSRGITFNQHWPRLLFSPNP